MNKIVVLLTYMTFYTTISGTNTLGENIISRLNPRELDVLNILWKFNKDMTSTDIVNEQRSLTQSTVIAVLRKLLKDDLVEIAGVTHSGKVLSRTYRPTEESKEVIMCNFANDYAKFKNIIDKSDMCAAILGIEQNSGQMNVEIAKLKEILINYEKKLKECNAKS